MAEASDDQAAMQHYLVCDNCQQNGQFYCNACHRPLCEQCRNEHLNGPENQDHEIVFYQPHQHQLPVEKCKLHPTRNVDMFCRECEIPICSKCSTMKEHKGHGFDDLEEIQAKKYASWQDEILKIKKYFLPTTYGLKTDIEKDVTEIKKIMETIRTSMKVEADSLKNLVDEVTSENIEHNHAVEKSLLKRLESQETTYDNYIAYLGRITNEFQEYLSTTIQKLLFSKTLKIETIPETTKPVPPSFTAGRFNKDDVTKLLGRVDVPNIEPEKREIQPMEAVFTEKRLEQSKYNFDSVVKVREYSVPGVENAVHVSVANSDKLWVSDFRGNLRHINLQGKLLKKIQTNRGFIGYHSVTQDGSLIYSDKKKKMIFRITPDMKITELIKIRNWDPISVHSSRINGDILVGMNTSKEAKVTRYSKAGKEMQNIQKDSKEQELFSYQRYITENINGDICTSDSNKEAVVVVNKSGQHRFSYKGRGSFFLPWGICTDVLGHILVCNSVDNTVHLLDQDGGFVSAILHQQEGIKRPRGVCVDDENNLYVGQDGINTVTVYKYLK